MINVLHSVGRGSELEYVVNVPCIKSRLEVSRLSRVGEMINYFLLTKGFL